MPDTHGVALAYLSIGSNLGDREGELLDAIRRLEALGTAVSISSFYETEPMEVTEQPWFLNCAVAFETDATAGQVMAEILRIEEQMGRKRIQKKGPRNIDVDILLFENDVVRSTLLTIPHPAMQHRRFVLEPLAEIAPEAWHPVLRRTIRQLLETLPPGQMVRRVE